MQPVRNSVTALRNWLVERWPWLHRFGRVVRFGAVGVSGIVVNTLVLWLLVRARLPIPLASALASEAAILSNFFLNDRWTFAGGATHLSMRQRLLRFNGVALGGMIITATVLTALTVYGHLPLLIANLVAVGAATAWNYLINTRWTWRRSAGQPRADRHSRALENNMDLIVILVLVLSLLLFAQSLFSLYLMLFSWERPERLEQSSGPKQFAPPQHSFTVLLPARHEEAVIYDTIKRVWACNYPNQLLEVVVICHADDTGTIDEARRAVIEIGSPRVRVETFNGVPINKPRGLNVGLGRTTHEVVTIFDAEDDMDPDIFNVVNTVMATEEVGVVQAGVQLINYRDHWFAIHNVLEYFFWFKSRLHFHAAVGMIPLGGNTVFVRRTLLRQVGGWDENCLTEDADLGLRLSGLGQTIRVVYDAQHVTREETPDTVSQFVKQRTRWHQGFLQVLRKGSWHYLPKRRQRLLAIYTLSYPIFQAILTLLWPLMLVAVLLLKLPVAVTMVSFLPLYALLLQLLLSIKGAWMFAHEYKLRFPWHMPLMITLTFLPYQVLLGISAVRAVYRELRKQNNWEKTRHVGAHRNVVPDA